jgi:hypothetical protein
LAAGACRLYGLLLKSFPRFKVDLVRHLVHLFIYPDIAFTTTDANHYLEVIYIYTLFPACPQEREHYFHVSRVTKVRLAALALEEENGLVWRFWRNALNESFRIRMHKIAR